MKSIEQEELKRLQDSSKRLRESRSTIADIELSLARLESNKKSAIFNAEQSGETLNTIQEELQQKYGNVIIDLQTGEIKEEE